MKVKNLTSPRTGSEVANQFIISGEENGADVEYFQSYKTIIGRKTYGANHKIELDRDNYDYSRTTAKYRNRWLGMTSAEIERGIKDGSIKLVTFKQN